MVTRRLMKIARRIAAFLGRLFAVPGTFATLVSASLACGIVQEQGA